MILKMGWRYQRFKMRLKDLNFELEHKIVAFSTVTKEGRPHTIAAEINRVIDNIIIITNNQMNVTPINLKGNSNVSILIWDNEKGFRIEGKAEYHESGEYFKLVKSLPENKDYKPKGAIVVKIKRIIELG